MRKLNQSQGGVLVCETDSPAGVRRVIGTGESVVGANLRFAPPVAPLLPEMSCLLRCSLCLLSFNSFFALATYVRRLELVPL